MNKAIEKYDGKTIRVNSKIYRIRISGQPENFIVWLGRQGEEIASDIKEEWIRSDHYSDHDYTVWSKANDILREVEDNEEVEITT